MITQRFAVEFDRRTVGIAVRVRGGFVFYGSDKRFDAMSGRVFRRVRGIERELKRVAKYVAHKRSLAPAPLSA